MSTRDASPVIRTFRWQDVNPLDPDPQTIMIEDIARSLSNLCRYNGHVNAFYSVGEHSLRVSHAVPLHDALWGLLHDASEAYLGDLMSPLKYHTELGAHYRAVEEKLMRVICQRFGLSPKMPASVVRADHEQLQEEQKWLREAAGRFAWQSGVTTMPPLQAELEFLNRFRELTL